MLAYAYLLIAVIIRLVAGTGTFATLGFTPLGASLLFFGARMPRKQFWVPAVLLIATDVILTTQIYHLPLLWDQMLIWGWYVGALFIGVLLRNRIKPLYIAGGALGTAVSFFLVSNFAVWLAGNMYPMNWSGLLTCYTAAIPFFRKEIASDLLFSAVFFGIPALMGYFGRTAEHTQTAA